MYCKKCGKEIIEEFGTCPYCKTSIEQKPNSYNHQNNKQQMGGALSTIIIVIGIIILIYGFSQNIELAEKWDQHSDTKTTTTTSTTQTYPTTTATTKNYQQIYNEYSQKLINAGPTSSINEMADILYEGVEKMATYMYSASGTDGQYATYQSWVDKLTEVYMENVR